MRIKIHYESIDGYRKSKTFRSLLAAAGWAHGWVGPHAELGSNYAISADGIGKITCEGCMLASLFDLDALGIKLPKE